MFLSLANLIKSFNFDMVPLVFAIYNKWDAIIFA